MADNLAYRMDDTRREELFGGEVVMLARPTINHNRIAFNIARIFAAYLDGKPCEAFADGVDLHLSENERYVPDGMIVCEPSKIQTDGVYGTPDLVVEVLSPSTAKNDKGRKKDVYEACGVREYWIVDPVNKSVEVYLQLNGRFTLDNVYSIYPGWMLKKMTEEECSAIPMEIKCSLFDDLVIRVEDVFDRVR